LQHGYPQVVQLALGGCDAFGLALQYDPIPAPRGIGDGTIWGLVASPDEIDRLRGELTKRNRPMGEATALPASLALEGRFAFQDPDGSTWERCAAKSGSVRSLALRYVSLEATDLSQAEEFYSGQLGLECEARLPDLLGFSVGQGGLWLLVRKVAEMSPRA